MNSQATQQLRNCQFHNSFCSLIHFFFSATSPNFCFPSTKQYTSPVHGTSHGILVACTSQNVILHLSWGEPVFPHTMGNSWTPSEMFTLGPLHLGLEKIAREQGGGRPCPPFLTESVLCVATTQVFLGGNQPWAGIPLDLIYNFLGQIWNRFMVHTPGTPISVILRKLTMVLGKNCW